MEKILLYLVIALCIIGVIMFDGYLVVTYSTTSSCGIFDRILIGVFMDMFFAGMAAMAWAMRDE